MLNHFHFKFEHSSWRAMLIKDNSGDWGICSAAWKGLTPGIPGRPGKFFICNRTKPISLNKVKVFIFFI